MGWLLGSNFADTAKSDSSDLDRRLANVFKRRTIVGLVLATFTALGIAFYTSDGRLRTEMYFFDIRTQLKPNDRSVDNVVLLSISDESVRRFEGENESLLSTEKLVEVVEWLEKVPLEHLLILAFEHVFPYTDPSQERLVDAIRRNRNFSIGTLGQHFKEPTLLRIPGVFDGIEDRVFGTDSLKKRSNSIVRSLPYSAFLGVEYQALAPLAVAKALGRNRDTSRSRYYVNYIDQESFPTIDIANVLDEPAYVRESIRGKTVILGYTSFRQVIYQTNDQPNWNTPLKADVNTYRGGAPVAYVTALAIENLLNDNDLKPASWVINFFQVATVSTLCFLAWGAGAGLAPIIILFTWFSLVGIHVLMMDSFNLFIPIADVFLFSLGTTIMGLLMRVQYDLRRLAVTKTRAESQQEIASLQSSFLDQFAVALSEMNDQLWGELKKIPAGSCDSLTNELVSRANVSCEEFAEYLAGIKQLAELESDQIKKLKLERFDLFITIERVLSRFEAKLAERQMTVDVNVPDDLSAFGDSRIFDTILFNYVSNAIKYSADQSLVRVEAAKIGSKVRVTVSDSGPGIAEEFRERIFEKFYRIKNDDVYRVKGTGLGLYLCAFFAGKMGAHISLDSELGRGSSFHLDLKS